VFKEFRVYWQAQGQRRCLSGGRMTDINPARYLQEDNLIAMIVFAALGTAVTLLVLLLYVLRNE
jgi:hypothetical protein